jgi:repressor LexA
MDNKLNALNEMYNYAVEHNLCKNKSGFAQLVGVANSNLSHALKGDERYLTDKFIKKTNEALGNKFDMAWLFYGVGNMLVEHYETPTTHLRDTYGTPPAVERSTKTLPLIPIEAVAGFNGYDAAGVRLEDCTQYTVPEFAALHADFLIRVSGSSMYPKYSSGDILACRKLTDVTFFQWGKVYVLDSNQGAMVKRLFPSENDPDKISCHSDNENYPPFDITKSDIRSVSIVVGAIRFE